MTPRKKFFVDLIILSVSFIFCSSVFATSTAFWRPYTLKPVKNYYPYGPKGAFWGPYGLFLLNTPSFSDYTGLIKGVEKIGNVYYNSKGKFGREFGGCAEFNGNGAIKYITSKVYPSGQISIEAWIKVKKYPKDKGYIVYREPVVPGGTNYKLNKTAGFSLYIDSKGGLNLSVTNVFYGATITTSSPAGIIPLNKWVWVAGISGSFRTLYVNGKVITQESVNWGQGLMGTETVPGPIYIGNNVKGNEGFIGSIDQVRIDDNVSKFWPKENISWAAKNNERKIPTGPPYFLKDNQPVFYLPLDGNLKPAINKIGNVQITSQGKFSNEAIRGKSFIGNITLQNKHLINLKQGSIEFWFQPRGYNTLSDWGDGILNCGPFNFYLQFTGVPGPKSLALYFQPAGSKQLEFVYANWTVHDGKWQQVVITWKDNDIRIYINGKLEGENQDNSLVSPGNKGIATSLSFQGFWKYPYNQFDEIYLYNKSLTRQEVGNCYWRYRDPAKLKPVQFHPVSLLAQYFPSYNLIYYKMVPNEQENKISRAQFRFVLRNEKGRKLFRKQVKFSTEEATMKIPYLKGASGYKYSLSLYSIELNGKEIKCGTFKFERRHFAWENNTLGKIDKVHTPFTPVKAEGRNVSVVLRKYQMNGFGLWNKVISKGKNILAGPIVIKYTTQNGEGRWEKISSPQLIKNKETYAIYSAGATAKSIQIKTESKVEFDGAMKVKMQLLPGKKTEEINRIYIDIPIKEKYAPLFHEVVDGLRDNYAGWLPQINQKIIPLPGSMLGLTKAPKLSIQQDQGIVWNSTQAERQGKWLDSFVSYIWLGGEERGIAFFGDNDKGWYTIKDGNKTPIQEIIRKGNAVVLRIYLADHPVILKHPTILVFGLDVSPTKPMPKHWRIKLQYIPRGLPVNAWGGLDCSYGTPYKNHWSIVDKIIEARNQRKVTKGITQWFEAFAKKYNPPPVYGTWNWGNSVETFAGYAANDGPHKPITCYTEEMDVNGVRKEWRTYLYEWTSDAYLYNQYKKWPNYSIYRQGINAGAGEGITWDKSERDYAVWLKNEWLKRGVGLYWDNFCPHLSYNFRTTPAYITKTGQIQPCVTIWEVRKYIRRVFNLLAYWRQHYKKTGKPFNPQHPWQGTPIEFVLHMTNTLILPWDTFATADLDNELGPPIPMQPNRDRTETLGLQVGNYPLSLYPLYGSTNPNVTKLTSAQQDKINWGMEMVHEIKRAPRWQSEIAKLDKIVFGFGYGTKQVNVYHYWSRKPALRVNNNKIKWIILSKQGDRSMLIILSNYSKNQLSTPIKINYNVLGINNFTHIKTTNVLTGNQENMSNIKLQAPYGVDILKVQY